MRTVKKMLSLLLTICCIGCITSAAFAAGIQPMMDYANQSTARLSIDSSGKATCYASVSTYNPLYNVSGVITLYRVSGGRDHYVDSWSAGGIGGFTKSFTRDVDKGSEYKIIVYVTISDCNGNFLESAQIPSSTTR